MLIHGLLQARIVMLSAVLKGHQFKVIFDLEQRL